MNAALPRQARASLPEPAPSDPEPPDHHAPPLHRLALGALGAGLPADASGLEADWLRSAGDEAGDAVETGGSGALARWWAAPPPVDATLHALAVDLGLDEAQTEATALALAAEFDAMAGRALAWLQAPVGSARPTLGLLASLGPVLGWGHGDSAAHRLMAGLCNGVARACGLLQLESESRPLAELALQVPLPLALALQGGMPVGGAVADGPGEGIGSLAAERLSGDAGLWPGLRWLAPPPGLPPSLQRAVQRQAEALRSIAAGGPDLRRPGDDMLVVRSGHPRESREAASALAQAMGLRAVGFGAAAAPAGAGPWLVLQQAAPVWLAELAPGELLRLPALPGWRGPVLVAAGPEGQVEFDGEPLASWTVPLPLPQERAALWRRWVDEPVATRVGQLHRHSMTQIGQLGSATRRIARLQGGADDGAASPAGDPVHRAMRLSGAGGLGTLAQWLPEDVADDAMVAGPALREALQALRQRCLRREGLADALGLATRTRYRPGVRSLMVGPSGTGKTLAAAWLACSLGLPLFRVDVASVSSKYIGETEKNLAQLFARAEHAQGVLLFDEADALFGKRTDVKDANDRFANQQTNYLLQRIETFDGIVVLTSNSRSRFDSAFTRRLDAIIDFPAPGPDERRALWLAHLGDGHALHDECINRIAAVCDLAGGHIRNATLAAASRSIGAVGYPALCAAIEAEYRKLGRQVPAGL